MHLKILMQLDNAAFTENDNRSQEAARILRELADRLDGHPHFSPGHDQALLDANGNDVGFAGVYEGSWKETKARAVKITITRAEGPPALCVSKTFEGDDCWGDATAWLVSQCDTFPETGGYHKHDLNVTWSDGDTFKGRLDCQHPSRPAPDLDVTQHVQEHFEYYAGLRRPAHMTNPNYGYEHMIAKHKDKALAFLNTHAIG